LENNVFNIKTVLH